MKKILPLIFYLLSGVSVLASVNPESDLFFKYLDRCRAYHSETTAEYNLGNSKFSYIKNIKGYNEDDFCEVTFTISSFDKKHHGQTFDAIYCKIPRKKLSKLNKKNFDEKSGYCNSAF